MDINCSIEENLIENMRIMHILKIIHRDIKPNNIMWSNEFQKPVFIDFGQTSFITETIGFRT